MWGNAFSAMQLQKPDASKTTICKVNQNLDAFALGHIPLYIGEEDRLV